MTRVRAPRISDRLAACTALRLALVALALGLPAITGRWDDDLLIAGGIELAVAAVAELVRRSRHDAASVAAPYVACLDGTFVVVALALTGGIASPVLVAVYLLLASTTLLLSSRAGIGVAIWCGFVLAAVHAASDGDVVSLPTAMADEDVAVVAVSFVVFALAVAAAASLSEQGLRRGGERLAALVDLGTQLDHADRDDDVLVALVRHACSTLGFDRASVVIQRGEDWRGASVLGGSTLSTFVRSGALDAAAQRVMDTDQAELVRRIEGGVLAELLDDASNVVLVPVSAEGEPCGVLAAEAGGRRGIRIPAGTVEGLTEAAAHAGLTLRHRAMVDEIERLATRDALTGLANRRLLEEQLDLELARSRREGSPLSVVVVDVDHFKDVNDTYGHLVGDDVLREIGAVLDANTKGFDLAARYGGDEFVVLLPGCSRESVEAVAERLRRAISAEVEHGPVSVERGRGHAPRRRPRRRAAPGRSRRRPLRGQARRARPGVGSAHGPRRSGLSGRRSAISAQSPPSRCRSPLVGRHGSKEDVGNMRGRLVIVTVGMVAWSAALLAAPAHAAAPREPLDDVLPVEPPVTVPAVTAPDGGLPALPAAPPLPPLGIFGSAPVVTPVPAGPTAAAAPARAQRHAVRRRGDHR